MGGAVARQIFPLLVRQRAGANDAVVLVGFNNGYVARREES